MAHIKDIESLIQEYIQAENDGDTETCDICIAELAYMDVYVERGYSGVTWKVMDKQYKDLRDVSK